MPLSRAEKGIGASIVTGETAASSRPDWVMGKGKRFPRGLEGLANVSHGGGEDDRKIQMAHSSETTQRRSFKVGRKQMA